MKHSFLACGVLLLYASCTKTLEAIITEKSSANPTLQSAFKKYTIKAGEHNVAGVTFKPVETAAMNFLVRFDSSAIYQSQFSENQDDINKLYGFSDNGTDHHQFSARIGWGWSRQALRLYAYVYNDGRRVEKEICTVPFDEALACSIKITATTYDFTVGDIRTQLPRLSTSPLAKGYQLYPYFGGDETAPHEVNIWIKDL